MSRDIEDIKVVLEGLRARADAQEQRAGASEGRALADRARIGRLEGRADMDAALLVLLQAEGVMQKKHAADLEEALRSSRMIGTAIGVVMTCRKVSDVEAFELLRSASMHTNRKLRDLAEEIVFTGDLSPLGVSVGPAVLP